MKEFLIGDKIEVITVSTGMTGKMEGMVSISTSKFCNEHCKALSAIDGSICQKCYADHYLKCRPNVENAYAKNARLLSNALIKRDYLPFINARYCRLESFGDIINATHLENYVRIAKKNSHCIFSLFTKQYALVSSYFKEHKQPSNFRIVFSSLFVDCQMKVDDYSHLKDLKVFTVYNKEYAESFGVVINCGGRKCIDCLQCYNKGNASIKEQLKNG